MKRLFALFLSVFLLAGCGSTAEPVPEDQSPAQSVLQPVPEPEPIVSHLMVAGDAMSHMPITWDAYVEETDEYRYDHILAEPAQQLAHADYALANLETVLGGGPNYTGYPDFNSPDGFAFSLRRAGFDLLSTANNHSRDQGVKGIYRTLDVLDEAGLAHVGTYRSQEERDAQNGIHVADVGGISVAFLSYTYGLNGYQLPSDAMYAANVYNLDYYTTICTPDYEKLKTDLAAARALDTDLIAVIMHWGIEYQDAANHYQTELAEFLSQQGVDLILGGHPHVLQPYERFTTTMEDGSEQETFVCYSLGNFVSNQQELKTKTTAILDLELTQDVETGQTRLTDVRYTPYFMLHQDQNPVGQRRHLINIHDAMAEYESGDTTRISEEVYGQLSDMLRHTHAILGAEGDRPSC